MIKCTEFSKLLDLPDYCCWGCYDVWDEFQKGLFILPATLTGLNEDAIVCCWHKMEFEKWKQKS